MAWNQWQKEINSDGEMMAWKRLTLNGAIGNDEMLEMEKGREIKGHF